MHSKRLNNACVDLGQDFKKRPFTALTNTPNIAVKPGKSEGEGENEETNWYNIREMIESLVDRAAKDVGDGDLTNKMDQARKALEKALAALLKFPLESEKSKQGNAWFLKQLCRVLPHDPALHNLPPPASRHSKEWATLVGWWLVHRMQLCLSQSTQEDAVWPESAFAWFLLIKQTKTPSIVKTCLQALSEKRRYLLYFKLWPYNSTPQSLSIWTRELYNAFNQAKQMEPGKVICAAINALDFVSSPVLLDNRVVALGEVLVSSNALQSNDKSALFENLLKIASFKEKRIYRGCLYLLLLILGKDTMSNVVKEWSVAEDEWRDWSKSQSCYRILHSLLSNRTPTGTLELLQLLVKRSDWSSDECVKERRAMTQLLIMHAKASLCNGADIIPHIFQVVRTDLELLEKAIHLTYKLALQAYQEDRFDQSLKIVELAWLSLRSSSIATGTKRWIGCVELALDSHYRLNKSEHAIPGRFLYQVLEWLCPKVESTNELGGLCERMLWYESQGFEMESMNGEKWWWIELEKRCQSALPLYSTSLLKLLERMIKHYSTETSLCRWLMLLQTCISHNVIAFQPLIEDNALFVATFRLVSLLEVTFNANSMAFLDEFLLKWQTFLQIEWNCLEQVVFALITEFIYQKLHGVLRIKRLELFYFCFNRQFPVRAEESGLLYQVALRFVDFGYSGKAFQLLSSPTSSQSPPPSSSSSSPSGTELCRLSLARLYIATGDLAAAAELMESVAVGKKTGRLSRLLASHNQALLYFEAGSLVEAQSEAMSAISTAATMRDFFSQQERWRVYLFLSKLHLYRGTVKKAEYFAQKGWEESGWLDFKYWLFFLSYYQLNFCESLSTYTVEMDVLTEVKRLIIQHLLSPIALPVETLRVLEEAVLDDPCELSLFKKWQQELSPLLVKSGLWNERPILHFQFPSLLEVEKVARFETFSRSLSKSLRTIAWDTGLAHLLEICSKQAEEAFQRYPGFVIQAWTFKLATLLSLNERWEEASFVLELAKWTASQRERKWLLHCNGSEGVVVEAGLYKQPCVENFLEQSSLLPRNYAVISLAWDSLNQTLWLCRYTTKKRLVVKVKRDRNIEEFKKQFFDILEEGRKVTQDPSLGTTLRGRRQWWQVRTKLDEQLGKLLEEFEWEMLGCLRGLFLLSPYVSAVVGDVRARLHAWLCSKLRLFTVDDLTRGLDDDLLASFTLLKEAKMFQDVLYLLKQQMLDQWGLKLGESDADELVQVFKAVNIQQQQQQQCWYVVLIPDATCQVFPWESLSCLRNQPTSRVPGWHYLIERLLSRPPSPRADSLFYVLNPSKDLTNTQAEFEPLLSSAPGLIQQAPTLAQLELALLSKDVFLYLGHGGGDYPPLLSTPSQSCILLMGCSSGRFKEAGLFDPVGIAMEYLNLGCPLILANLWDVTDKDIDRLTKRCLTDWGLLPIQSPLPPPSTAPPSTAPPRETPLRDPPRPVLELALEQSLDQPCSYLPPHLDDASPFISSTCTSQQQHKSMAAALSDSRSCCTLAYLNGAAPVIYGLPDVFILDK